MELSETPNLQWFRGRDFNCRQCGKRGDGNLMGRQNEDYGIHCKRCADKRLAASKKVRESL
jgi:hypothetical protein